MTGELDFGTLERARDAKRRVLRAVDDAVGMLTLSVAAGACDMRASDLRDAIDGRNGRRLDVEAVIAIALRAPAEVQRRIWDALNEVLGDRPKSPQEELAELKLAVVEQFGQAGAALVRARR